MVREYAQRKPLESAVQNNIKNEPSPAPARLRADAALPAGEQTGHRVDLPEAIRSKMESAFGADLSAVKLYESQAVADHGANAVAQGSDIAFAPGMLDFSSYGGQALLGHELSHVVSQARGEVTGGGFLRDGALEARADREGAMAAAGRQIAMPTASLSPVSAAAAAGPMQADKKDEFPAGIAGGMSPDFGDSMIDEMDAAEAAQAAQSASLPAGPLTGLDIAEGSAGGMFADFGDAQADEIEAAEAAGSGLQLDLPGGSGAGMTWDVPETGRRKPPAPKGKDEWGFSTRKGKAAQFTSGAGFLLGMENADDPQHGEQFQQMMAALKPLAVARGNSRHMGDMAYDAIEGNAYDRAIAGMEAYRSQLKSEKGNFRERWRQMKLLKQMIASARADKAASEAEQSTTLGGGEFTGKILSGGINQVYRFARGGDGEQEGQGAFFKPKSDTTHGPEDFVMSQVGIRPPSADYDPRLANREIAFSRLGSLLGSSVTIGAKKATLGKDTPTHKTFGGKTFEAEAGSAGVLMEEAEGHSWDDYNWSYHGLGRGPDGAEANARTALIDTVGLSGDHPHTVGDRLGAAGAGLEKKSTKDAGFSRAGKKGRFSIGGDDLDMADADFQQQMNEMFLLDTLAGHRDRHEGNFRVNRGEDGRISVKAIDNDLTFGTLGSEKADAAAFGKQGAGETYGGLPTQMQVDAEMAQKILGMKKDTLKLTFSDLLDEKEIDSLWTRFQMMQDYISDLDPSMLVEEWNDETAKREIGLAGGVNSFTREGQDPEHPYTGNNYYQRQFMLLSALEKGDAALFEGARGRHLRL